MRLEKAAKCASEIRSEKLAAHHLAKAEKLIIGVVFNTSQIRALISMYDRVQLAASKLGGTIPIKQHCEEMKQLLRASIVKGALPLTVPPRTRPARPKGSPKAFAVHSQRIERTCSLALALTPTNHGKFPGVKRVHSLGIR